MPPDHTRTSRGRTPHAARLRAAVYSSVREKTPLDKVQRYICNRAAGVCKKKPPPVGKRKDYKFRPMTAEEKQMADMQANLKDTGARARATEAARGAEAGRWHARSVPGVLTTRPMHPQA